MRRRRIVSSPRGKWASSNAFSSLRGRAEGGERGKEGRMDTEKNKRKNMPYWGADRRVEDRPGVPRETPPHPLGGAHWTVPEQQTPRRDVLVRADIERLTPVFG